MKTEIAMNQEVQSTTPQDMPHILSFRDMLLVSHALGTDMFEAVMSLKLKDKRLPKIHFYRNYYHASEQHAAIDGIDVLIEKGFMYIGRKDFYHVTDAGIKQFRLQFAEVVIYKPKAKMDVAYLKHRINFYCEFYDYKFCDDNSAHVIDYYQKHWLKKERVSHTTADVIRRFHLELKRFCKPQDVK